LREPLPEKRRPAMTMRVRGVLLDLDGTLYVGDSPIEGAREAVARLEGCGFPYRYITNTTREPRCAVAEKLRALGFPADEDRILTPAVAARVLLAGRRCHALVAEALLEDLEGVEVVGSAPECVLVGDLGEGFTYARLNAAFRHLMDGAGLVCLQKNRYWRTAEGLSLDAGPFVAALEYASGQTATVVGKPEVPFFGAALRGLGLAPSEVAMVGDDLEGDVLGAQRAGLAGIRVKTGKYRPGMPGEEEPDLVLESVADLPAALGV
jgi:HAD superfamily hydrolase (TIGR01458 family)